MHAKDSYILSDIAFALVDHMSTTNGASHFADLTTGEVTFILSECMFNEDKITESEIAKFHDWEQEQIRTYLYHELVAIEPIPSSLSFHIMETFADTRSPREQDYLYKALRRKRPFAGFHSAVEKLGVLQQWYDFKNEFEMRQAKEWLSENNLEIYEGKIIRVSK